MNPRHARAACLLATLIVVMASLSACNRDPAGPAAQAAADQLEKAARQADTDLAAVQGAKCADASAIDRLATLADDIAARYPTARQTAPLLRQLMDARCPALQARVILAARALRPLAEGKSPKSDLIQIITAGLTSTDAAVRAASAMTLYELRLDPRGSKLPDLLKSAADTDPDEKVRTTAAWVQQQLDKSFR